MENNISKNNKDYSIFEYKKSKPKKENSINFHNFFLFKENSFIADIFFIYKFYPLLIPTNEDYKLFDLIEINFKEDKIYGIKSVLIVIKIILSIVNILNLIF